MASHCLLMASPPQRVGLFRKPLTVESVGPADRAAALDSDGLRACQNECQPYKGQNRLASASTKYSYTINLGTTPWTLQGRTGVPPSGDHPGKDGTVGKWSYGAAPPSHMLQNQRDGPNGRLAPRDDRKRD